MYAALAAETGNDDGSMLPFARSALKNLREVEASPRIRSLPEEIQNLVAQILTVGLPRGNTGKMLELRDLCRATGTACARFQRHITQLIRADHGLSLQ